MQMKGMPPKPSVKSGRARRHRHRTASGLVSNVPAGPSWCAAAARMLLSYRHGLSQLVILTLCILSLIDWKVMPHSEKEFVKSYSSAYSSSTVLFGANNDSDSQELVHAHPTLQSQSQDTTTPTSISVPTEQESSYNLTALFGASKNDSDSQLVHTHPTLQSQSPDTATPTSISVPTEEVSSHDLAVLLASQNDSDSQLVHAHPMLQSQSPDTTSISVPIEELSSYDLTILFASKNDSDSQPVHAHPTLQSQSQDTTTPTSISEPTDQESSYNLTGLLARKNDSNSQLVHAQTTLQSQSPDTATPTSISVPTEEVSSYDLSVLFASKNDSDSQLVHARSTPRSQSPDTVTPTSISANPTLQLQSPDTTETSRTSMSSPTVQVTQLLPDGCGIEDGVEPQWRRQTPDDLLVLADLKRCKQRLCAATPDCGDHENPAWRDDVNVTYLDCHTVASLQVLSKYRTIYMIGDSLLRQQFMVLNCMFNLSAEMNVTRTDATIEYRITISHADGSTTDIIYTPFGYLFGPPDPLYKNEYPAALANGTEQDMIIINAGHHYSSEMASTLKNDAMYIVEKARGRPIHVYFMETTDEEWPTSNGIYTHKGDECCCNRCSCKVHSADRLQGKASLDVVNHNFSIAFGRLNPDRATLDPLFDPDHELNHPSCVPDCYPANWRNVLVREILQNQSNVHVVPTWRQLVARKLLNSFRMGDCTHQAVDTLVEVNRQLLRTVIDISRSTTETSTSISSPTVQVTQLLPDGCGIEDGVEPQWRRQTPDDLLVLADLKRCKQRLVEMVDCGDEEDMAWRDDVNVTYLDCHTVASLQVLSKYRTIYMIGDSLLRQQFMVLNCMFNLSAEMNVTRTDATIEHRITNIPC